VVALILRLFVGPIFDRVRSRNTCSVTVVRKIFHAIGFLFNQLLLLYDKFFNYVSIVKGTFIPGIAMIVVSQMDPVLHKYLIVGVVTIGHAFSEGKQIFEIALT